MISYRRQLRMSAEFVYISEGYKYLKSIGSIGKANKKRIIALSHAWLTTTIPPVSGRHEIFINRCTNRYTQTRNCHSPALPPPAPETLALQLSHGGHQQNGYYTEHMIKLRHRKLLKGGLQ